MRFIFKTDYGEDIGLFRDSGLPVVRYVLGCSLLAPFLLPAIASASWCCLIYGLLASR